MFPGLVNCTTIDWFTEWPADALYEVAVKQMAEEQGINEDVKQSVCKVTATVQQLMTSANVPSSACDAVVAWLMSAVLAVCCCPPRLCVWWPASADVGCSAPVSGGCQQQHVDEVEAPQLRDTHQLP
jgi:hypothetical protein